MKVKLKRNEDELRGATRDLRKELSRRKKLAGRHVNMKNEWWKKKMSDLPLSNSARSRTVRALELCV